MPLYDNTLLVTGRLNQVDEGNRFTRIAVGLGAGESRLTTEVHVFRVMHSPPADSLPRTCSLPGSAAPRSAAYSAVKRSKAKNDRTPMPTKGRFELPPSRAKTSGSMSKSATAITAPELNPTADEAAHETSTRPARLSRFECATGGCALPNSESASVTRVESDDQSRRCECRTRAFAYTSRGLADNWSTAPSSESVPRLVFLSASPTVSLPRPFHSLLSLGHRGSRDEGNAAPWVSGESQIPRAPRPPLIQPGPEVRSP